MNYKFYWIILTWYGSKYGQLFMQSEILPDEQFKISEIEKAYGFKLTEKRKIDNSIGYAVNNGRVVGLGLCRKKITDISVICKLSFLQKLDLNQNSIEVIPDEIKELKQLTELRISNNHLKALPSSLGELKALKKLWINGNQIARLPLEISKLNDLEFLGAGDNKFRTLPDHLCELCSLKKLWMSGNNITSITSHLTALTQLRKLDVSGNEITELPESIGSLKNLVHLDISGNRISVIPNSIGELTHLSSLLLGNNRIYKLPESLYNLSNLIRLTLSSNLLESLSENISNLNKLQGLELRGNSLKNLPLSLSKLTNLKALICVGNKLDSFSEQITAMTSLQTLLLDKNQISSVPETAKNLVNLQVLGLSHNKINEFPSCLRNLPLLKDVSINGNNITRLPDWVGTLKLDFIWKQARESRGSNTGINLYGNPFEEPPIEIVADGKEAVDDYFADFKGSKAEDTISLYEGKLLIVGEGDVGKTHIANKLMFDKLPKDSSTQGIDIHQWLINTENIDNFRINLWDFAGQAICHATHQFFLTSRSLYLFIWEARSDQDVTHFDYWLNIIKLLSNNSPVLIVMNKCDVREKAIDQNAIQKEFPNVIGFHKISALKGYGIDELKDRIYREMESLPMIGKKLIKQWVQIRADLESKQQTNYITYSEYLQICSSFNVNDEKAARIAQYYHDIGVILHFRDDPILKKYVVLNPEWATDAVYAVVDNRKIQKHFGKFNFDDLADIWIDYPEESHIFLIELMKKFELCFELAQYKDFIVPELLNPTQVAFDWNYQDNLCFQYQYTFMPAGIITRFTVRQHEIIFEDKYWKNGVYVSFEDTDAIVICDPFAKTITINISGNDPKGLLAIIRKDIKKIHESLNEPNCEERIPCICEDCKAEASASYHLFSKIQKFKQLSKRTIECDSGNDIMINELLGEYGMENDINSEKETYNIYGDNTVIGDNAKVSTNNIKNLKGPIAGNDVTINNSPSLPSEKKWYEKVGVWIGIVVGLIAIYTFISPFIDNNNASANKPSVTKSTP